MSLVLISTLLVAGLSSLGAEGSKTTSQEGIVLGITVYKNEDTLDNATVEVLNSTGDIVKTGSTDQNGSIMFSTTKDLSNSTVRVGHEDLDQTYSKDIDIAQPGTNETTIRTLNFQVGTDYSEEAKDYYDKNPYIVAGGGVFILILILVGISYIVDDKRW